MRKNCNLSEGLYKMTQLQETISVSLVPGILNMRVWTCRKYPKDHIYKTRQRLLRRSCPAWSHGTRRGILSWPSYDLEKVSSSTVSLCFLVLVSLTYLYCKHFREKWYLYEAQHNNTWSLGYDLLALFHSTRSTTGVTMEFRWGAAKVPKFPLKAKQDLVIASPSTHFLLVMY